MSAKLPAPRHEHYRIAHRVLGASDLLTRGLADVAAWRDVADAVICRAMAEVGRMPASTLSDVEAAELGMVDARPGCEIGLGQIDGPRLEAVRRCCALYDTAVGKYSRQTMAEARDAVEAKIRAHKAAKDVEMVT